MLGQQRIVDEVRNGANEANAWSSRPAHTPVVRVAREVPCEIKGAAASRGLAQTFGLDIRAAILVTLVDLMLFGVDILSVGAFIVMGLLVAAGLGVIVYKIQRQWYGDDHESSLIKAMIVGLLTAIPVPLTPLVAVPCGMVGMFQMVRRRSPQ
jgi:hypothetical protein